RRRSRDGLGRVVAAVPARQVGHFVRHACIELHERAVAFSEQFTGRIPHFRAQFHQAAAVARDPRFDVQAIVERHRLAVADVEARRRTPLACVIDGPAHRFVDERGDDAAVHAAGVPLLERARFVVANRPVALTAELHVETVVVGVAAGVAKTRWWRLFAHAGTCTLARPSISISPASLTHWTAYSAMSAVAF